VHGRSCSDSNDILNNKALGSLRISFGASSTFADARGWISFLEKYFILQNIKIQPVSSGLSSFRNDYEMRVERLTIFPIKSCGGFNVECWPVKTSGLVLDRHWRLVDGNGKTLTQKRYPQMCLIRPIKIDLSSGIMVISAPGKENIELIFAPISSMDSNTSLANNENARLIFFIKCFVILTSELNQYCKFVIYVFYFFLSALIVFWRSISLFESILSFSFYI